MNVKDFYWAVINKNHEEWGWNDCFFEPMIAMRGGGDTFCLAIFATKKQAQQFKKEIDQETKKFTKIQKIDITFLCPRK